MAIIKTHTYDDGSMVGFDEDSGEWVPLDESAEQGSFAGNVVRGAGRGVREIMQGLRELGPESATTQLEGEALRQEREAAERSAPWAEFVGNVAPDMAAGLGAAAATGGLGLPAIMATEAGLGALLGGIRPGDAEERGTRALVGAAAGVVAPLFGQVAAKGVGAGLAVGEMLSNRILGRVGETIETSASRLEMPGGAARHVAPSGAAEADRTLAGPSAEVAAPTSPSSVGAARNPNPDDLAGDVLRQTEAAGAESSTATFDKALQHARDLGFRGNIGQGTRAGSGARTLQAVNELNPLRDPMEQWAKASDQELLVKHARKAMGDTKWNEGGRVDLGTLANNQARIGEQFRDVERRLPQIEAEDYAAALKSVEGQTRGAFGKTQGQKLIQNALEDAEAHGSFYTPEEIMADRKFLSQEMADFFANGRPEDGAVLMDAISKLDDLIDRVASRTKKESVVTKWRTARRQWQLQTMIAHGASVSPTGDINPRSLLNQMKKAPSRGGFGPEGPARTSPEGELFDLLQVAADADTGIPMTGARMVSRDYIRPAIRGAGVGAAGAAGYNWLFGGN